MKIRSGLDISSDSPLDPIIIAEKRDWHLFVDPPLYDRVKAFCEARKLSMNKAAIIALETMLDHVE